MKKQTLFAILILFALGMACGLSPSIPKENQLATVVAKTLSAQPAFTPISTLTAASITTELVNSPTVS